MFNACDWIPPPQTVVEILASYQASIVFSLCLNLLELNIER